MKQTANRLAPYFPSLGLVLILAGGVAYFITRRWDLLPNLLVAGGALLLLLFAILQPDAVRRLSSARGVRYGSSTVLSILFFTAILALLYYLAYQNPDWRYDSTETNEFTPLPETIQLLEQINQPIHVLAFYSTQGFGQREEAEQRLNALQAHTDKLTFEFIDPVANPVAAQQYEVSPSGTMVFTAGDGSVFAESSGLTDRAIHTALLKIIDPTEKKIYFLIGHGEFDTKDFSAAGLTTAVTASQDLGFTIDTLDLRVAGAVPEDAVALVMAGQQVPTQPEEIDALRTYLSGGGAALIARDLLQTQAEAQMANDSLTALLRDDWGIVVRNDLIIDPVSYFAGQPYRPIGASYGNSPVTGNELPQFGTVFDLARSIETTDIEGVTKVNLVVTTEDAWGESSLELVQQNVAEPNPEDAVGPLTIAVSAENVATQSRLLVLGDVDFMTNNAISIGGNNLLFTNALSWLANDEVTAELTPRETVDRQLVVDQSQLGLLWLMAVCLAPGVMAIVGAFVWYSRRNRR